MMISKKRADITNEEMQRREAVIKGIERNVIYEQGKECGFDLGNNKTGKNGGVYDRILVWNMPYVITCPGASDLCRKVCYNAAYDTSDKCMSNYMLFCKDSELLERKICKYIENLADTRIGIRLHSSGDFFSKKYIDMWTRIVRRYPAIQFWAYTRSWVIKELKEALDELELSSNISLYYSWDETMRNITCMHKAAILGDIQETNNTIICPEQFGVVNSCADCGICANNKSKNILFYVH